VFYFIFHTVKSNGEVCRKRTQVENIPNSNFDLNDAVGNNTMNIEGAEPCQDYL
jgi:hypothetical protein